MAGIGTVRRDVFLCYSHADRAWLKRLQVHRRPLVRDGKVKSWDDTMLKPGVDWRSAIEDALASAKVAVLFVSADFLASDFIANEELPKLLKAAEGDGAIIIPLIVSPSRFTSIPSLARFQAVNPSESAASQVEALAAGRSPCQSRRCHRARACRRSSSDAKSRRAGTRPANRYEKGHAHRRSDAPPAKSRPKERISVPSVGDQGHTSVDQAFRSSEQSRRMAIGFTSARREKRFATWSAKTQRRLSKTLEASA